MLPHFERITRDVVNSARILLVAAALLSESPIVLYLTFQFR